MTKLSVKVGQIQFGNATCYLYNKEEEPHNPNAHSFNRGQHLMVVHHKLHWLILTHGEICHQFDLIQCINPCLSFILK